MHKFDETILRAYDIRGVYDKTLYKEDAYFVGMSFGSFAQKNNLKKVAVGFDGRKSSPQLKENLIKGLVESGIEVFEIGLCPTPMLYFAIHQLECDAGIMITGSHNPKDHNGFKISLKNRPFYGEDIKNLSKIAAISDFFKGKGSVEEVDISNQYVDKVLSDCSVAGSKSKLMDEIDNFSPEKKLRIAWDCGNGAAGEVVKKITERIKAKHVLLYEEIDGNFPNHHPDPTDPKNLQDLIKTVNDKNCDLGIAFDGDGDRIGAVDNEGNIIWGDELLLLYAKDIIKDKPNSTIIADVKASQTLFDEIYKIGGQPIMWKTGHSLIKAKMIETNASLAGEMSGHIFFADKYFGFDDAIYAAIRLINIVVESSYSLAYLKKQIPKSFSTPEIRIDCDDDKKFDIIEKIKEKLTKEKVEFNDIDGIRLKNDQGWWLIRASNTQPAIVARCESNSEEDLEKLKSNLDKILSKYKLSIF